MWLGSVGPPSIYGTQVSLFRSLARSTRELPRRTAALTWLSCTPNAGRTSIDF
jgi:hypothetical protein